MKGSYAFLDCLREAGIRYIFGNVGTTEVSILDALVDYPDIRFVTVLHEIVALGMAEGYARISGTPAVAMVHTAAGTANGLGGLMNAYKAQAPVLLVAGEKDIRLHGRGHFIEAPDLLGIARQFSKAAWKVTCREKLQEMTFRALRTCATPPQGPVFLAITEDVSRADYSDTPPFSGPACAVGATTANPDDIAAAARLLAEAQSPLIIAGGQVGRAGALPTLVEIAELLDAAVILEDILSLTDLCFPTTHRLYVGQLDPLGELPRPREAFSSLLRSSDVILGAGCKMFMEFRYSDEPQIPTGARLVHVCPDPAEVGKIYRTDVGIVADTALALGQLRDALRHHKAEGGMRQPALYRQRVDAARRELVLWQAQSAADGLDDSPLKPWQVVRTLSEVAPRNALVVNESITSAPYLFVHYEFGAESAYMSSNAACLGWAIPAALGARLAEPRRPVVAFVGNGSALFAIQGLWTAAHLAIPVVMLVVNNHLYNAVRWPLSLQNGRARAENCYVGCEIDSPPVDFVRLAEGFGVRACRVASLPDLRAALQESFTRAAPTLIEALIQA